MRFESPWFLLLLLVPPALLWMGRRRRAGAALRFSSTGHAARAGRSARQRMLFVPPALRALALALLALALARPQKGREQVRDVSRGIAIEMVVDRSGSMGAEMEYKGRRMTRLDVVKQVFQEFVLGNGGDLPGRPNDLIGMVAFARYPDTVCPLSLAHGVLPPFLEAVRLVQRRSEDGTAIGDALALAAARLKTAEETLARQWGGERRSYDIKSKIVILLTDGENNCGKRRPEQAAELAAQWGIKVYTVGVGGGEGVTSVQTPFGVYKVATGSGVDASALRAVASATGGLYREAGDAKALLEVYREIDRLERSEVESVRYVDYREAFPGFALAALAALSADVLLRCTLFRRIP